MSQMLKLCLQLTIAMVLFGLILYSALAEGCMF